MAVNLLIKRSSTANKRPVGASMAFGELNLNYDSATGALFYKNSNGDVVKVGPCEVGTTAPNSSPEGSSGNSLGEFWYDTATSTLKVYDGVGWVETGGAVQGITATAPITVDNTDPLNPVVGVDDATTSSAGVVQLTDSVSTTSSTLAATATAVKTAYDQALAAAAASPLASATVLFVNATTGNNTTGQRGTAKPFLTIGAALTAASPGDTIYIAAGTYTENVTLDKAVTIVGAYQPNGDPASLVSGTQGTIVIGAAGVYVNAADNTAELTVSNVYFKASTGSSGMNLQNVQTCPVNFIECGFEQFGNNLSGITPGSAAVVWSSGGSLVKNVTFRLCVIKGNIRTIGAGTGTFIDCTSVNSSNYVIRVEAGALSFTSGIARGLASISQTGGSISLNNAIVNISNSNSSFWMPNQPQSYFGTGGSIITNGLTQFSSNTVTIGAGVTYSFFNLLTSSTQTIDTSLATQGTPITNGTQYNTTGFRPQLSALKTASSVSAADQQVTAINKQTGLLYSLETLDGGDF